MSAEHVTEVIEEDPTEDNTDEEPRIDEDEPPDQEEVVQP